MPDFSSLGWPTTLEGWIQLGAGLVIIAGALAALVPKGRAMLVGAWRAVRCLPARLPVRIVRASTLGAIRGAGERYEPPPIYRATIVIAPAVTVTLADPPDETREPYLEWPHIAVKNTSDSRLVGVHADVLVTGRMGTSGTLLKLRWDPDDADPVILEPRETRTLPLCLRSREANHVFTTSRRGTVVPLTQWICYVTDEGFLLNGDASVRLGPGDADLRVRVMYGDEGEAEAWFRAYVSRIEEKPLWIVPLSGRRTDGREE